MKWKKFMEWIGVLGIVGVVPFAGADETLQKFSWEALKKEGRITAGAVEGTGSESVLRVMSDEKGPTTLEVLAIDRPKVARPRYAIRGRVRAEGVEGKGYLEMWNHFGDRKYFSRTLSEEGPMKHLGGSTDWREFVVPFVNRDGGPAPDKLELNVVLPGKGTVWLGTLELVHFEPGDATPGAPGAWWGDSTAGLVFGILGSLVGILGALVGTLCSLGRARGVVTGILWFMIVGGAVSVLAGIVALAQAQPYAVVYPLFLMGGLNVVVPGTLLPVAKRRFQDLELRKMSAMDAGRS